MSCQGSKMIFCEMHKKNKWYPIIWSLFNHCSKTFLTNAMPKLSYVNNWLPCNLNFSIRPWLRLCLFLYIHSQHLLVSQTGLVSNFYFMTQAEQAAENLSFNKNKRVYNFQQTYQFTRKYYYSYTLVQYKSIINSFLFD
jgi:hypothetical protein